MPAEHPLALPRDLTLHFFHACPQTVDVLLLRGETVVVLGKASLLPDALLVDAGDLVREIGELLVDGLRARTPGSLCGRCNTGAAGEPISVRHRVRRQRTSRLMPAVWRQG